MTGSEAGSTPVAFAVPGDLAAPTGGYAYAREILARFADCGIDASHIALPGAFPFPDANDIAETERLFRAIPARTPLLIDGLAFGAMPHDLVAALPHPIAALVHHPLALETGLDGDVAARLERSERLALAAADHVIATSQTTAATLVHDYAVSRTKLTVAVPGVMPRRRARSSGVAAQDDRAVKLLSVGAISERKGYDILVAALSQIADADWTLDIIGSRDRNPDVAARLDDQIAKAGLGDRIRLSGAVTTGELERAYQEADLFVLSSRYEGYGMVLTEALACGLPIVSTTGGAAAQTVPDAAALKVAPDDPAALRAALVAIINDPQARAARGDAAWAVAERLPRWDDTTATIARALKELS